MPLKYPCFISYCHGQRELMQRFIEDLKNALSDYLEPFFDEDVYIDTNRLVPGYQYNEALATALCQSVCMIVVYVPRYGEHEYCVREYEAMERLEKQRKELVKSPALRERGMIIPIVLRGAAEMPPKIRNRTQYLDFSKYTTASPRISRNKKYVEEIDRIARYIYEIYQELKAGDVCSACGEFALPPASEVPAWDSAPVQYPR